MTTAFIILAYGVLVAVIGAQAYFAPSAGKEPSTISLLAGGVSGLVLLAAGFAMMRGAYTLGWWIALVVTVLLLARFAGGIFSGNFTLYPAGVMTILSFAALVALIFGRGGAPVR